ncbi:UNVERIFIED_CONTAM: putative plastid-lipid-associated protein 13, chloroplastic [Sesamum radiatum]|uniref:Plastid-lipid-associated protein 13, chloroplastic n=1 Tax=Sesamum radiatum TaxID=300843 RepID=A0AAW2N8Y5_SESRA
MACSIATYTPLLVVRPPRRSSSPPSTCILLVENPDRRGNYGKSPSGRKKISGECRAMVQQTEQGPSAAYAKEMERLSAKESLFLAFKDAGGLEALVTGRTTDIQRIDLNESIVSLERLNPTPRPTMSPYLEGRWNFEWFGSGSPGLFAATFLFERFPQAVANLSKLDVVIKDGYANISASVKLLNSIESGFIISTRLTVEGPLRMKGEYIEGILEYPKFNEESIPQQLRGALDQAASTMQQLPVPITDAVAGGLKVPLGGTFERLFMISYLDEEILIIRDTAGAPEVLRSSRSRTITDGVTMNRVRKLLTYL